MIIRTRTRTTRWILLLGSLALVAVVGAPPAGAAAPDQADALEPYERDVYEVVGSTLRNPTEATDPDAPLFNVAGVSLGVTWGEFSSASVTSRVQTVGGPSPRTSVRLALDGLIADGVYSIFYATLGPDSENPLCPGVERLLPLPSVDDGQAPDASSFVAGADGAATFRGEVDGALLEDHHQVFFAVIHHADGLTYGPLPNRGEHLTHDDGGECRSSFGHDAMRQVLVLQQW